MRRSTMAPLVIAALLALSVVLPGKAAEEGDKLAGKWKLTVLAFGEDDMVLVDIDEKDGKLAAEVVDAPKPLGEASIKSLEQQGGRVTMVVDTGGVENVFTGTPAKDDASRVLGTYRFRGTLYPAQLEKTDAEKLRPLTGGEVSRKVLTVNRETDAKERVEKLEALLEEIKGPARYQAYTAILRAAEDAELTADQVRKHLKTWFTEAEPYGQLWVSESRLNALKALAGQKPYAELTLELAQQADQGLPKDAPLEQQAGIVQVLASSAKLAGKLDVLKTAEARLAKIETQLDEEYLEKVPPFKPEKFAGRAKTGQDRVVLLELFTGAQCPPCVAADVGFDALLKTYQPSELVALQYHLHIPGPDPLTNADSVERSKYYAVRGTPSTYFNGQSEAGGGGGMANAENKYNQYRELIDNRLEGEKLAAIDLNVSRSGNKIHLTGSARVSKEFQAEASSKPAKGDKKETKEEKDADEAAKDAKEPKLRLRLALTEELIRYVGGNKLRFHHHVVRGLPGGVEGKELVAGECQINQEIDLDELREQLCDYLDEYAEQRAFPNPLPEIALDGLSVTAFVQNDTDKQVLHAVVVKVPAGK